MPIFDKEGNVYKLRGPNPIMKSQTVWDKNKISLINFNIGKDIQLSEPIPIPEKPVEPPTIVPEPPIVEAPVEIIEPPTIIPEPVVVETIKQNKDKRIINMHCLPMTLTGYSNKFIFEGVMLDESDMQMMFWTNIDLMHGSIIFPMNEKKRWWKVYENQPKNNGWFTLCNPSDIHPDLS